MDGINYRAVIFDMDGVLVDSEPVIEAAAMMGLAEYDVLAKPEDFVPFIGAGEDRYIGGVAEKYGARYKVEMKKRVYEIYLDIVSDKLNVYEGTLQLLATLRDNGYILALASSADQVKIDANLKVAGIAKEYFSCILSGEDVSARKPSPDIYIKAAEMIGIPPCQCIVIEDALNGIEAAKSAGMMCIGVATSFNAKQLEEAGADAVCDSIDMVHAIIDKL